MFIYSVYMKIGFMKSGPNYAKNDIPPVRIMFHDHCLHAAGSDNTIPHSLKHAGPDDTISDSLEWY